MLKKLLVTTALEETWGKEQSILFLGEWCKLYERKHVWGEREHETQPHHWLDRDKLRRDHDYLKQLYERVLETLSHTLNEIHGTKHGLRYWRILVGPWLISYIPTLFDRWECLRIFFERNAESIMTYSSGRQEAHLQASGLIDHAVLCITDSWNHHLFLRIIRHRYSQRVEIIPAPPLETEKEFKAESFLSAARRGAQNLFKKPLRHVYLNTRKRFGFFNLSMALRLNTCIFHTSQFSVPAFLKLCLSLREFPFFCDMAFDEPNTLKRQCEETEKSKFRHTALDGGALSDFETYLFSYLLKDIPPTYLERFEALVKALPSSRHPSKKVLFSSNSYIGSEMFKIMAAGLTESGSKLVIILHGGSLPMGFDYFDHDPCIADYLFTWYKPLDNKSIQLPPSKLSSKFVKDKKRQFCTIIGCEISRYAFRATAVPMAEANVLHFNQVIELSKALDSRVSPHLKFRPYPNRGWNTRLRFEEAFGKSRLTHPKDVMYDNISESKVIICTYPSTTFAESMASGIPTVICYPKEFWELNPVSDDLVALLAAQNMLFHDPLRAAAHINNVWDDPDSWWLSSSVRDARDIFLKTVCCPRKEWKKEWAAAIGLIKANAWRASQHG